MRTKILVCLSVGLALAVLSLSAAQAQETSRVIPFNNLATSLPPDTTQSVSAQLWDVASGGTNPLFTEGPFNVNVDANGNISFVFGSQTTGGLDPANFPSGSSRYLDVVDSGGASVLPGGRVALNATPFALSPGPQGPQGNPGPPGPPGVVQTVTAADTSIAVGGTATDRVVAVAANGISNVNVANGVLSPLKIAGTAATLGANAFVGGQSIAGHLDITGNLGVSFNFFANTITTNNASFRGQTTIVGNGLTILIGDVGCGPPTAGIAPAGQGAPCATFALGMDASATPNRGTYINRATGGKIAFREGNGPDQMTIAPGGNVRVSGTTTTGVLEILGGADLSERFEVSPTHTSTAETPRKQITPGMVLSIDPKHAGRLIVSSEAYDRRAAGVISGAGGVKPGMLMGQSGSLADGDQPVALAGRVYCLADATNGSIEPGDLLTTSNTPGHAMKVSDHIRAQGAIIGKALTELREGKGLILILVTLR